MLEFVNEWGMLGLASRPPDQYRPPSADATTEGLTPVTGPPFTGEEADQTRQRASEIFQRALRLPWGEVSPVAREKVADWQEHIARVWQAIEILEMYRAKSSSLGTYFNWNPDGRVNFDPRPPGARSLAPVKALWGGPGGVYFKDMDRVRFLIADAGGLEGLGIDPGDLLNPNWYLLPAKFYVQNQVNRYMAMYTQLLITEKGESIPIEVPGNLLAFMWFLVGAELTGKLQLKKCQYCGARFVSAHRDCECCPGGTCGKANRRSRQRDGGTS
ncbi:MAG: hypothetical protein HY319_01020 [Armatimonadetes bacterium]|nr:hypothetical protein [Armatimonadota bacterium]